MDEFALSHRRAGPADERIIKRSQRFCFQVLPEKLEKRGGMNAKD